ncbi:hypothetical protein [Mesonia aestuariivivens]|uniref:DUF4402 domain-containing protein n=1 Tax=Mesonia aestuariivivens TaxID=2796128 RepID=A0ABS6W1W4_9FLAO|nr:hypothetical protein [Mesonia aestuariivivens]MBW2961836.1 hypothetical protein [Mesonia aestuariivivens]
MILFGLLVTATGFSQQKAEVQFSVHLGDFQSIVINSSQNQVGVHLDSKEDVLSGKGVQQNDHIKITSTSQYQVNVSSSSELMGVQDEIPAGMIQITPSTGTTMVNSTNHQIDYSKISLSTQQQTIINSSKGDIERSFNMNYFVKGGVDLLKKAKGNYKTTISYSIIPN